MCVWWSSRLLIGWCLAICCDLLLPFARNHFVSMTITLNRKGRPSVNNMRLRWRSFLGRNINRATPEANKSRERSAKYALFWLNLCCLATNHQKSAVICDEEITKCSKLAIKYKESVTMNNCIFSQFLYLQFIMVFGIFYFCFSYLFVPRL